MTNFTGSAYILHHCCGIKQSVGNFFVQIPPDWPRVKSGINRLNSRPCRMQKCVVQVLIRSRSYQVTFHIGSMMDHCWLESAHHQMIACWLELCHLDLYQSLWDRHQLFTNGSRYFLGKFVMVCVSVARRYGYNHATEGGNIHHQVSIALWGASHNNTSVYCYSLSAVNRPW